MKTVWLPETVEINGQSFVLRDVTEQDANDVLTLHQRVFGSAVDHAWFDWKYMQGHGEGVGLWHAEQLVAFCGGTPRQVWHQGTVRRDLQIGDVMVAPEWRGILTRKGPFYHVCRRFYVSRLGSEREFFAGFGFPNKRHLRLAVKTGLSWDSEVINQLYWTGNDIHSRPAGWVWQADWLDSTHPAFGKWVDQAWDNMSAQLSGITAGVRDANYWRWRFVQRPDKKYRFLGLRRPWQRRWQGIAVLSAATNGHKLPVEWLDWVGPLEWMQVACTLAVQRAVAEKAPGLSAWASPWMAQRLATQPPASTTVIAGVGIPKGSSLTEIEVSQLNAWWTGGDTDFL